MTKTVYYIDYQLFVNVLKFRLHKLSKVYEQKMKSELENKGYVCGSCQAVYSALEVQTLIDPSTFLFLCEVCQCELVENKQHSGVKDSQTLQSRLMDQIRPLVELLKKTDSFVIPA